MAFDPDKSVSDLRENGFAVIPNAFSASECAMYRDKLNAIARRRAEEGKYEMGGDCHNVWNFFRHDEELMPLVWNKYQEEIFNRIIDEDHVVIAVNAINRQKISKTSTAAYADNWHTDSRYVGGKRLEAGFTFGTIIMLDAFTEHNGATWYIPKSHLDRRVPDRYANYDHKVMTGDVGTLVVWDFGLWHRGGQPSEMSRWAVFNMYGPWFVKPYWRYPEMIGEEKASRWPEGLRKLFHFDANPPLDDDERIMTLMKNYRNKA